MSPTDPNDDVVVRLEDVSKRYVLHKQKPFLIREVFHRLVGRSGSSEAFWAIKDVSFEVKRGEAVGFIGHNGAGKSTLLGLVAETIHPTQGKVMVKGRLGTLLELGAGFHPDLTGRENIYLNASLLGLSKDEIEERFETIVEFSELGQFIDVALKKYSSGMQVRLGFSVAIHVDPDMLIMDEVLAVGDEQFQQKCLEKVEAFQNAGKTILFVSHNITQVRAICQKAIWLEHGKMQAMGEVVEVTQQYIDKYN